MNIGKKEVSMLEFKRLLYELKDKRPDICVRYRLIGKMWTNQFMRVIFVYENGVLFYDNTSHEITRITNVDSIMQFEIDNNFQIYQAHFHYDIVFGDDRDH